MKGLKNVNAYIEGKGFIKTDIEVLDGKIGGIAQGIVNEELVKLDKYYDDFIDMLIFDALIFNTDRHGGNFGLLVDNKTNKPIALAPIFDNGLSLFNYAMDDELEEIEKYSKTRGSAFGVAHIEIAKEFITSRQKAQLRKMINFKFTKHARYNLSAQRLKKIEAFLQKRVQELLAL